MTSRAGQALNPVRLALEAMAEAYGNGVLHQQAVTALAALDGFEQEVRDDIRTRVEALPTGKANAKVGVMYHDIDVVDLADVLRAISSSSATETQDGPPVVEESELDDQPEALASDRFYATETQDGERTCAHERGADFADNPSRFRCLDCGETVSETTRAEDQATYIAVMIARERADAVRAFLATPTPDDRDREVERLLDALLDIERWSKGLGPTMDNNDEDAGRGNLGRIHRRAREVIDAGLRASGGER